MTILATATPSVKPAPAPRRTYALPIHWDDRLSRLAVYCESRGYTWHATGLILTYAAGHGTPAGCPALEEEGDETGALASYRGAGYEPATEEFGAGWTAGFDRVPGAAPPVDYDARQMALWHAGLERGHSDAEAEEIEAARELAWEELCRREEDERFDRLYAALRHRDYPGGAWGGYDDGEGW